jgi:hypothetical protein
MGKDFWSYGVEANQRELSAARRVVSGECQNLNVIAQTSHVRIVENTLNPGDSHPSAPIGAALKEMRPRTLQQSSSEDDDR